MPPEAVQPLTYNKSVLQLHLAMIENVQRVVVYWGDAVVESESRNDISLFLRDSYSLLKPFNRVKSFLIVINCYFS